MSVVSINQVSFQGSNFNGCPQCSGKKWINNGSTCPTCLGTGQQKVPYEVAWSGVLPYEVNTVCENRSDMTPIGSSRVARDPQSA